MSVTKVLFVCHGNICRSPMAQYVFSDLVKKDGLEDRFVIDSAATSREEIGNPVYPPARRMLAFHGITKVDHRARQLTMDDYREYDHIVLMDGENMYNAMRMTNGDPDGKLRMMLDDREVDDPWYSGDFSTCYRDILEGCEALLEELS